MTYPAFELENFDNTVRPADDLFRHVNGIWLDETEIPNDKSSTGVFSDLNDASELAVHEIVESLSSSVEGIESKIAHLYSSFMDEQAAERKGAAPLKNLLSLIDSISSPKELAERMGWATRHKGATLYGFYKDADPGNPKRYIMFCYQSGLGLPDEAYYREDAHKQTLQAYQQHIAESLQLAGYRDATQQAKQLIELETKIAKCHWDRVRVRDMRAMYNLMSWQDFTATCPQLEWDSFLSGADISAESFTEVVVSQPSFFSEVAKLFNLDLLDHWKAWARFHLISGLSPFLSKDFVNHKFNFYQKYLQGIPKLKPRWKRGVQLVESVLGEAIGKIYVSKYFSAQAKERTTKLVNNLLEAYHDSITSLEWMSEETKAEALKKLSKFRTKIGYPDTWRDYQNLVLLEDDLVGNILRANSFELDYALEKLSKPIDPDEWFLFPQTVNAYYHPLRNEIVFPAAILQPPLFNVDADDAVNYGSIGAIIGHEIGHGFDDQGSTCDGDGCLRNWWTEKDRETFEELTKSLITQYNALSPREVPEQHVNGELTIGENIGDLGGLAIAYKAWLLAGGKPEDEKINGYTPAQRFFLSWAQSWKTKTRVERLKQSLATNPHSPEEFRCNQVARNLDPFYQAFNIQPSDKMWLDPSERVKIW